MNKTIWKFPLAAQGEQRISMPQGAEILTVQRQDEQACLWAIVSPQRTAEVRFFEIHGTGNPIVADMGILFSPVSRG